MPLKAVIKELVAFETTFSGLLLYSIKTTFISFHKLISSLTIHISNCCDHIKATIRISSISFSSIFPKMLSSHTTIIPNRSLYLIYFSLLVQKESFSINNNNIKYKYNECLRQRMSFFVSDHMRAPLTKIFYNTRKCLSNISLFLLKYLGAPLGDCSWSKCFADADTKHGSKSGPWLNSNNTSCT